MTLRGALAAALVATLPATAAERPIPPAELRPGSAFVGETLRAQQSDEFANPGMLWVERGGRLWGAPAGASGKSCADCHGAAARSMQGVAARHPAVDRTTGRLRNVADRIVECRVERQRAAPPQPESEELLALEAFVVRQSLGMPLAPVIDGPARPRFEAGQALYRQRIGQMNLACSHCHDANWGRTLYTERISQGHPIAFPAYRLEWQTLGSLERRIRACFSGVRAEMLPYGAPEHRDLELYLAWRAGGLPIESPGVRR